MVSASYNIALIRLGLAVGLHQAGAWLESVEPGTDEWDSLAEQMIEPVTLARERLRELGTGNNRIITALLRLDALHHDVIGPLFEESPPQVAPQGEAAWDPATQFEDYNRLVAALLLGVPLAEAPTPGPLDPGRNRPELNPKNAGPRMRALLAYSLERAVRPLIPPPGESLILGLIDIIDSDRLSDAFASLGMGAGLSALLEGEVAEPWALEEDDDGSLFDGETVDFDDLSPRERRQIGFDNPDDED